MRTAQLLKLAVVVAFLQATGAWSRSVPFDTVTLDTPPMRDDCSMCESSYQGGNVYVVSYYSECVEEHDAGCSLCYVDPSECWGFLLFVGDGCETSCAYSPELVELVSTAVATSNVDLLVTNLLSSPGALTYNRERGAIQVISKCGKVAGTTPLTASMRRTLESRLASAAATHQ